jgi:hypothetical protein
MWSNSGGIITNETANSITEFSHYIHRKSHFGVLCWNRKSSDKCCLPELINAPSAAGVANVVIKETAT